MIDAEARALVESVHRAAAEQHRDRLEPPPASPPRTMHFSQLTESDPESPLGLEWNTYLKNVGRLLQEGHENKHILIKDDQIIGMWTTHEEAMLEGYARFRPQAFFVHEIREYEPVYRLSSRLWRCQ